MSETGSDQRSSKGVGQFQRAFEATDRTFEACRKATSAHADDPVRQAREMGVAVDYVLAELQKRRTELGQLRVSGRTGEEQLVLEAGLTMAMRGALLMQTGIAEQDPRTSTLGAEQYAEGVSQMARGFRSRSLRPSAKVSAAPSLRALRGQHA